MYFLRRNVWLVFDVRSAVLTLMGSSPGKGLCYFHVTCIHLYMYNVLTAHEYTCTYHVDIHAHVQVQCTYTCTLYVYVYAL